MTTSTSDNDDFYSAHCSELVEIATKEFNIPVADAEQLAFDVFLSALRHRFKMTEPRTWLVAAITFAARHYNARTSGARQSVH